MMIDTREQWILDIIKKYKNIINSDPDEQKSDAVRSQKVVKICSPDSTPDP